jgi:stage III sporulation protein AD
MTVAKICGIVLICFCALLIAKQTSSSLRIFIPIAAFTVIFISIIPQFFSEFEKVITKYDTPELSKYILILFKALGISFLCAITSEICATSNERMLSEITVFAGKIEILVLSLPLITSILDISRSLI